MVKIDQKLSTFYKALTTLQEGIKLFNEYKKIISSDPTDKNQQLFLSMRDSMIQRFEYCTDLFWKVLKVYLEEIERVSIHAPSPRGVLRESVKVNLLTEPEGKKSIVMIKNRNETSHIYHQEKAQEIAHEVPDFYHLMKEIIDRIQKRKETFILK